MIHVPLGLEQCDSGFRQPGVSDRPMYDQPIKFFCGFYCCFCLLLFGNRNDFTMYFFLFLVSRLELQLTVSFCSANLPEPPPGFSPR